MPSRASISWSGDGTRLLMNEYRQHEGWVGLTLYDVTDPHNPRVQWSTRGLRFWDFAPDGAHFLASPARWGRVLPGVLEVESATGFRRSLAMQGLAPRYSPAGRRIAFIGRGAAGAHHYGLYVRDAVTGALWRPRDDLNIIPRSWAWLDEATLIAVTPSLGLLPRRPPELPRATAPGVLLLRVSPAQTSWEVVGAWEGTQFSLGDRPEAQALITARPCPDSAGPFAALLVRSTGEATQLLVPAGGWSVSQLALAPSGERAALAEYAWKKGLRITVWSLARDARTSEAVVPLPGQPYSVTLAWTANGDWLLVKARYEHGSPALFAYRAGTPGLCEVACARQLTFAVGPADLIALAGDDLVPQMVSLDTGQRTPLPVPDNEGEGG